MSKHAILQFLVAFAPFVILALAMVLIIYRQRQGGIGRGGLFVANLRGLHIADSEMRERVTDALQSRRRLEAVPMYIRVLAAIWIAAGIVLMYASATEILARWLEPVWYGIECIGLSGLMLAVYLKFRNAQPVRVAALERRFPTDVIPLPWFVIAVLCGCSLLIGVTELHADELYAAVFMCVSTLATTCVAWAMTGLPARLIGKDIEIERSVDDRVRFNRAASVLFLAFAQTMIFSIQGFAPDNAVQEAITIVQCALTVAYAVWMFARRKQPLAIKRSAA